MHSPPFLTFHRDVLDGEPEDDGPDHSQSHLCIAVHNLCTQDKGHGKKTVSECEAPHLTPAEPTSPGGTERLLASTAVEACWHCPGVSVHMLPSHEGLFPHWPAHRTAPLKTVPGLWASPTTVVKFHLSVSNLHSGLSRSLVSLPHGYTTPPPSGPAACPCAQWVPLLKAPLQQTVLGKHSREGRG